MVGAMWATSSLLVLSDLAVEEGRLADMERSTLQATTPIIRGIVEDAMTHRSPGHLRELLAAAGRTPLSARLALLDPQKNAVEVEVLGTGRKPRHTPLADLPADSYMTIDVPLAAQESCARCHGSSRGVIGYLRVVSEHRGWARAVKAQLTWHLTALALSTLALAAWTAGIVRRLVQAPLERVVAAMAGVAEGKLDTRLDDMPQGELRAIGTGFNAMARELEADRRKIVALHRKQVSHMERLAAVGELASHLAHEVRNPLTGIGSAIQLMQQETPTGHPRREILGKILGQLNRMDQTMANFLSFARMPEASLRPFQIAEPLNRVLFLLEPKLRAQGIELRRRLPEDLPTLIGDPNQIEEVFLNICLNAVHAMPAKGALTVAAEGDREGGVRVEFADTGCGIPADKLDLVFKPYYTTREKGSGLGLPIAKQIVMAHGGEIWIESIPDKGTSVFVRLPGGGAPAEAG